MLGADERLRVDLVNILGAGWPSGEPGIARRDLQAPNWRVVSGSRGQPLLDRCAGKFGSSDLLGAEGFQHRLLLPRRRRINPGVPGFTVFRDEFGVNLGRRLAGLDRKSTRLNSSHVASSYAVFCLKKKR